MLLPCGCSCVALPMLLAAERCAASPFCICSMTCAWLFFPISSNESAPHSASHGPPKSRQVSLFIKNLIPCSFRNADTFSFVRSVIRPVYVEVACFEFASDGMIRSIRESGGSPREYPSPSPTKTEQHTPSIHLI